MAEIRGIIKVMPVTGALLLVGGLAIAGMPPFNIFLSEFLALTVGIRGRAVPGSLRHDPSPRGRLRGVHPAARPYGLREPRVRQVCPAGRRGAEGRHGCARDPPDANPGRPGGHPRVLRPQPLQTLIRDAVQVVRQGAPCGLKTPQEYRRASARGSAGKVDSVDVTERERGPRRGQARSDAPRHLRQRP